MKEELSLPSDVPAGWKKTENPGLSDAEASLRKKNVPPSTDGKPTLRIILENVFTLFNGLNLLLAVALILAGSYRNMLFLMVVISNTAIAIIQEIRARNTIRRLKLLNSPRVRVIRNGKEREIAPETVAEGDLIVLRSGDQVPADCIAVSGAGKAMESLLTGESDEIPKAEGSWLYSGSCLTEGKIICQAVYVGEESYAGRLTREVSRHKKLESGLMTEMKTLVRWDTMVLLPLGLLLFLKQILLQHTSFQEAVPPTVAAMLGMIPEGLILLTSVAMAVGVTRLGKRQVLVQELYGIEGLARVDTICLDKTGTLTTGRMEADALIPMDADGQEARAALSRFLGAFDDRSSTLQALRDAVPAGTEPAETVVPFSSRRKKSAAGFSDQKTLILGAPEFVLEQGIPPELQEKMNELTREGKRVLILAEASGLPVGESLPAPERVLMMCSLTDEIRPHVQKTVRYFREQGVDLKVISGDNPGTVSRVAQLAGVQDWDCAVDARTLQDENSLREACEKYTVFGRVTPEQKKRLIEALQSRGHVVAMTGDGVNDLPALRAADCSIGMASGADAVRNAAQLTLLNSDFESVPAIVLEGRRVINNITRSATLFLTKTISSFLLSILALVTLGVYPFQPIQMSLVSACTVGVPGFILALENSRDRISGKFLEKVVRRALPGGVAVAVCSSLAMLLTSFGWRQETCSTIATWIAGAVGIAVLIRAGWPMNPVRGLVVLGGSAVFVLCVLLLGGLFYLTDLNGIEWAAMGGLSLLGAGICLLGYRLENRIRLPFSTRPFRKKTTG